MKFIPIPPVMIYDIAFITISEDGREKEPCQLSYFDGADAQT